MHIRRATGTDDMTACLRIRRIVFIDEQHVPEADELDDKDPQCVHFLALPGKESPPSEAFGTARLLWKDEDTGKAQRVAVLREHRNSGVGQALMFALEGEVARSGRSLVVLSAQLSAVRFYERLGYVAYGERFLDAGIEHVMMRKAVL